MVRATISSLGAAFFAVFLLVTDAPVSAQNFRILTPNGGERLAPGSVYTVTWSGTAAADDRTFLEVSTDAGASWSRFGVPTAGTYHQWTVPMVQSERCLVRGTLVAGSSLGDPAAAGALTGAGVPVADVVRFSASGTRVIAASDTRIAVWDMASRALLSTITVAGNGRSFAVSGDGGLLAVPDAKIASAAPTVGIYSASTGQLVRTISIQSSSASGDSVRGVALSPDGTVLAVAAQNFSSAWDVQTGSLIDTLKISYPALWAVGYTADGKLMLAADVALGRLTPPAYDQVSMMPGVFISAIPGPTPDLAVAYDAMFGKYGIWDYSVGMLLELRGSVPSTKFRPALSGGRYAWFAPTSNVYVSHYSLDGAVAATLPGTMNARDVALSGEYIAVVDSLGAVRLWSLPIRSDVSDDLFSIGGTSPVLYNIHWGMRRAGSQYDTTLTLIRNVGTATLQVTSALIAGPDAANFQIIGQGFPADVPAGASLDITLRVDARSPGFYRAELLLQTNMGTFSTQLGADVYAGAFYALINPVNIGDVSVGGQWEQSLGLLGNGGPFALRLDSVYVSGTGAQQLTILEPTGLPRDYEAGATISVRLRFSPVNADPTSLLLVFVDELGRATTVPVIARGTTAAVELPGVLPSMGLEIAPVPAHDRVTLTIRVASDTRASVGIVDVFGRVVARHDLGVLSAGVNESSVDLRRLPAGTYVMVVDAGAARRSIGVTVVR